MEQKDTINSYLENIDKSNRFQPALFETLKLRATRLVLVDKHEICLADEMSISEAIALDERSMEIQGFVNLGCYTPGNQLSTRADHALATFESKHSVTSSILSDLLTDEIILLHNSGFTVDAITMDWA
ncbi:hypothetical protein TSAR_006319 [Trichomalopsis sarcophagae]|uniref:Transposable element P transposase-like RNase H domain-containing protein n=1 Tax=Trichomalopsis sarcophagae TaxID=543379 RepID=A0A232EEV0_9HYME|nr:hypothetical protein TSAR_006319 [Trichomalopsis sarcophagae]